MFILEKTQEEKRLGVVFTEDMLELVHEGRHERKLHQSGKSIGRREKKKGRWKEKKGKEKDRERKQYKRKDAKTKTEMEKGK